MDRKYRFAKKLSAGPIPPELSKALELWVRDWKHPSLNCEKLRPPSKKSSIYPDSYSIRTAYHSRALYCLDGDVAVFYWHGTKEAFKTL